MDTHIKKRLKGMKTKEELTALKEEVEALNKKLAELTEDELKEVTGGFIPPLPPSADIPVRMISYGGSNYNISFLIRECDKVNALQRLSDVLFKSKN